MRIKFAKLVAFLIVLVNIIVVYYTLRLFINFGGLNPGPAQTSVKSSTKAPTRHISKLVSVVLRDFDGAENDVTATVHSFIGVFPNIQVFVLYDILPYPPLELTLYNNTHKNVRIINLSTDLNVPFTDRNPLSHIKTKYVLFVPDSTRITNKQMLHSMVSEIIKEPESIVAAPFIRVDLKCLKLHLNVREWTVKYENSKGTSCDSIAGKHVVLLETDILRRIPNGFLLPLPQSLYLQTAALNIKTKILKGVYFQEGKILFRSLHAQLKQKQKFLQRQQQLYSAFKIKQVVRENGLTDWYGCSKETPRCFGTVVDFMPSYLYEGRWTPPCCLANLRKTAKHVFRMLNEAGIRYWLEGGSLLGAMRNGDILPWDHNVDVGFNRDDAHRCQWLEKAKTKPVIDNEGFMWERANDGNFFKVYFSKANRINVNLLPFHLKNGTMTKDSWYSANKNVEFPDHFLHPMSSIDFIGKKVPSPNNIRDFLELKFGKGAIENPEYPDHAKLKFP